MSFSLFNGDKQFDKQTVSIVVLDYDHHGSDIAHSHSFYEFVYIERGFSLHLYNQTTTILTPGDLFALKPGDVHGYTSANHTHLYNCLFFSDALEELWDEVIQLPGMKWVFDRDAPSIWKRIHLDLPGRNQAIDYLLRMKWERLNKGPGWELNLKSLLIGFLVLFSRAYNECYGSKNEGEGVHFKYILNALIFIENNYMEDISVNDLASTTGLSVDYFSRQFKKYTGITPVEYIKSFRLAKAVEILKSQDIPISDVAVETGFGDPCYFTRQFRQTLGMSPSEYRKGLL